ncbi:hypothetical protein ACFYZI_34995 [Streptomyces griseorubiginosus]|uniref:hypothetical protein n=1 Tax=Streptomyces griseorubiginosus TaxID=67304 RepID=UPI0036889415
MSQSSGSTSQEGGGKNIVGTPSAPQPIPQSWVRGPKSTEPAHPETDGGTDAPVRQEAPAPRTRSVVAAAPRQITPAVSRPPAPAAGQPTATGGLAARQPTAPGPPAAQQTTALGSPAARQPTAPGPPAARQTTAPRAPAAQQAASPVNSAVRKASSGRPAEQSRGRSKRAGRAAGGRSREEVGWVKAHGGSGATSLVEALGGVDVGDRWPEPARGEPYRIVLVGRTSARGLRSVSRALGALKDGNAPQGLELLAVVLVADAPGRLPLGLLRRIRVLRSVAPVHRVPWIPAWRTDGPLKYVPRQLVTLSRLVGSDVYGEGARS